VLPRQAGIGRRRKNQRPAAEIDKSATAIAKSAKVRQLRFKTLLQATGIGFLKLEGDPANLRFSLLDLREQFESNAGSLVVLHRPAEWRPSMPGEAPVTRYR